VSVDTHTAAICDARGRTVSQLQVAATTAGYEQLLAWVRSAAGDKQAVWAVEGTRHYGLGLARHLSGGLTPSPVGRRRKGHQILHLLHSTAIGHPLSLSGLLRSWHTPVAQRALVDPEFPGRLRDRLAGLPDQPYRALPES
jgi:hypothetical protein